MGWHCLPRDVGMGTERVPWRAKEPAVVIWLCCGCSWINGECRLRKSLWFGGCSSVPSVWPLQVSQS